MKTSISSKQSARGKSIINSGVSRDDILWCYQNILERQPESDGTIDGHLSTPDFRQLVLNFLSSQEYIARQAKTSLHSDEPGLPPFLEKLEIELDANSQSLNRCAAKIKTAWEHLGNEKAHFSVLTFDAFLPENLNTSIDSFWASGDAEVSQVTRALSQFGFDKLADKVCVEYGCGVGRVTTSLAKHFKRVHGYDISRNHLTHARARAAEVAASNVEFHECAQDFQVAIEPCDFFYSLIVLQHNPPPIIASLIRLALAALRPSGVAIFQVPTYIVGYRFNLNEWLAANHALDMQMHCVPQDVILKIIADSGCQLISVREDGWTGAPGQMISNTFYCQKSSGIKLAQ